MPNDRSPSSTTVESLLSQLMSIDPEAVLALELPPGVWGHPNLTRFYDIGLRQAGHSVVLLSPVLRDPNRDLAQEAPNCHPPLPYRQACREYLLEALARPGMYFSSLQELQALLHGHAVAFNQISAVTRDNQFNTAFAEWLRRHFDESVATGWADAVERMAARRRSRGDQMLTTLATDFFESWDPQKELSSAVPRDQA